MSNAALTALRAEVARAQTVEASAAALIRGIAGRIQAAVDAAIANGATAEELAPVQAEADSLKSSSDDLTAAISENTGG